MNIVVLQENLSSALSKASMFLPSKTSSVSPVNNFLISSTKEKITITATDLETTITTYVPGKIISEGEILLPAKTALSLFSQLPKKNIEIRKKDKKINILCGATKLVLNSENVETFPKEKDLGKKEEISLLKKNIQEIIEKNNISVSSDTTRAVLTGVLFSFSNKNLVTVSTDGFRLSYLKQKINASWEKKIILPIKAVRAFSPLLKEEKINFKHFINNKKISISNETDVIVSRLIEGEFPTYEKIIPQNNIVRIRVNREDLLQAVKISSVFARESANVVRFTIEGDFLSVSSASSQIGAQETKLTIKKEGEDMKTAFNYRFLLDILNVFKKDEIFFESNGSLLPGVFYEEENKNFFHIIMPVRLQES